jgi:polyphosphate kinase
VAKSAKKNGKGKKSTVAADDQQQPTKLKKSDYEARMAELQIELVKMQYWVKQQGLKIVLIFEGRDAAGKGGTIKRLTEPLNPRGASVVALPAPSDRERTQWYFQRYVNHLPAAGEIAVFDRSWYNRGGVERVMGFCTEEEYREWLRSTPEFERMLVRSGIILLKYWFSVSDAEQEARFQSRAADPLKRWKLSPMDFKSREKWIEFSKAKDEMFSYTDIREAPWYTIEADDKKTARLNCISHALDRIPYEDALPGPIELPERPPNQENYRRPPKDRHIVVEPEFWKHVELGGDGDGLPVEPAAAGQHNGDAGLGDPAGATATS